MNDRHKKSSIFILFGMLLLPAWGVTGSSGGDKVELSSKTLLVENKSGGCGRAGANGCCKGGGGECCPF